MIPKNRAVPVVSKVPVPQYWTKRLRGYESGYLDYVVTSHPDDTDRSYNFNFAPPPLYYWYA